MPIARYFLWVGTVLLALLFIVDACLPNLPVSRLNGTPDRVIRISSEQKWPERIVFDTSAPMPRVTATASPVQVNPAQETAAVIPDRAREALAQLQIPDAPQMQMDRPKKQEEKQEARRWQKFAKKHVARPPLRIARHSQYAWFGGRMWW